MMLISFSETDSMPKPSTYAANSDASMPLNEKRKRKHLDDEVNFMTQRMYSLTFGQITIKVEMRCSSIINLLCLKTDSYKSSLSGLDSH